MKEFILQENEEILADFSNVYVKANENKFNLSAVLTNSRIVFRVYEGRDKSYTYNTIYVNTEKWEYNQ